MDICLTPDENNFIHVKKYHQNNENMYLQIRLTNVHFCSTHEHRKGKNLGTASEMFLQEKCI